MYCTYIVYVHICIAHISYVYKYFHRYCAWHQSPVYFIHTSYTKNISYTIYVYMYSCLHSHTPHTHTHTHMSRVYLEARLPPRTPFDISSCRSLSAKEPLIIGLFCRRRPVMTRHPTHFRAPVPVGQTPSDDSWNYSNYTHTINNIYVCTYITLSAKEPIMIMLFCGKVTYINKATTLDTTARGNGDLGIPQEATVIYI